MSLVEIWGFPGYWTFRVTRATVVHPAGRTVPSPIYGDGPAAFGRTESPRHPGFNHLSKPQSRGPRACGPTLRRTVLPRPAQGLTTHLSGSTLVRWECHPLEGIPNFRSSTPPSIPSDQHCLVALCTMIQIVPRNLYYSADPRAVSAKQSQFLHKVWSTILLSRMIKVSVPSSPLGQQKTR